MVVAPLIPVVTLPETMTMILRCGHSDSTSVGSPVVPLWPPLTTLSGATPTERYCFPCDCWVPVDAFRRNL